MEVAPDTAVRDGLARYCRGVDRLDVDLTLGVFLPEAPVDYVGIFTGPIEGFVEFVMSRHRELVGHFHQLGQVLVEGTRSEAYVAITLWKPTGGGVAEVAVRGRYLDDWVQDDGGAWRIARRTHVIDLRTVDGRPDLKVVRR